MDSFLYLLAGIMIIAIVIAIIIYVINSVGLMFIFKKGFREKGWKGFVPIYNKWILYNGLNKAWLFLLLIILWILNLFLPDWYNTIYIIAVIVINIYTQYLLCEKFNITKVMCILAFFLPFVSTLVTGIMIRENNDYNHYDNNPNNYTYRNDNNNSYYDNQGNYDTMDKYSDNADYNDNYYESVEDNVDTNEHESAEEAKTRLKLNIHKSNNDSNSNNDIIG